MELKRSFSRKIRIFFKSCIILIAGGFLLSSSACAAQKLEVREVDPLRGWAVYRGPYLIPEYTATRDGVYAPDRRTAEILFNLRKEGLEPYLKTKYDFLKPPGPANIPVLQNSWRENEKGKAEMEHYLLKTEIEYNAIQVQDKRSGETSGKNS